MSSSATNWSVYLVRNRLNALYCGISIDVVRRFEQHCNGTGAKALRGKMPLSLEWSREVGDQATALKLERKIKRLSKQQKERIIFNQLDVDEINVN